VRPAGRKLHQFLSNFSRFLAGNKCVARRLNQHLINYRRRGRSKFWQAAEKPISPMVRQAHHEDEALKTRELVKASS
jgi:hypothetical protein